MLVRFVVAALTMTWAGSAALAASGEGKLDVGTARACAVVDGGKVKCWGTGKTGELGTGKFQSSSTPVEVKGLSGVTQVVVGDHFACALHSGKVSCWGSADGGKFASAADRKKLVKLNAAQLPAAPLLVNGAKDVKAISMDGDENVCLHEKSGAVRCLLGQGDYSELVSVTALKGTSEVASSGADMNGDKYTAPSKGCGLKGDALVCKSPLDSDFVAMPSLGKVKRIDHFGEGVYLQTSKGDWKYWGVPGGAGGPPIGKEATGGLGTIDVPALKGAVQVAGNSFRSCALWGNGSVKCWGSTQGQGLVGNGKETGGPFYTPQAVKGVSDAVSVSAGNGLACALIKTGKVKCWGSNEGGGLGDGSTKKASGTPVEVKGLTVKI